MQPARAIGCEKAHGIGAWLPATALLVLSLPLPLLSASPVPTSEALVIFRPGVSARDAFLLATGAGASVIGQGMLPNSVVVAPGAGADAGSLREADALVILATGGFLCRPNERVVR
jgi:hypothetical protein